MRDCSIRSLCVCTGSPGGSVGKESACNAPAMQETGVQSLYWEVPLGKEIATQTSSLAWEIPWKEEPDEL